MDCPKCGNQSRYVGRMASTIVTWNCDESGCKLGGFSTHVWPEPGGKFTLLMDLDERRLRSAISTADITDHELALALRKESERRTR